MILSLQAELEVKFVAKLLNAFPHKTPFSSDPVVGKKAFLSKICMFKGIELR